MAKNVTMSFTEAQKFWTMFAGATSGNLDEVLRELEGLSPDKINAVEEDGLGRSLFMLAVGFTPNGDIGLKIVDKLIELGADTHYRDRGGMTVLEHALLEVEYVLGRNFSDPKVIARLAIEGATMSKFSSTYSRLSFESNKKLAKEVYVSFKDQIKGRGEVASAKEREKIAEKLDFLTTGIKCIDKEKEIVKSLPKVLTEMVKDYCGVNTNRISEEGLVELLALSADDLASIES